ncbi:MAG TPA: hypothetical protein VFM82_02650 [Flavobacteriaceae bacterium]|nr:hypothetical protein [Flavobacteriaceae bacterium]
MIQPRFEYDIASRRNFRIAGEIDIDEAQEKLWQIITQPGHLENFHPFVKNHDKVKNWHGVGSKDSGSFYSGKKMNRIVSDWKEGKEYSIKMKNSDQNDTRVRFALKFLSPKKTSFSITINTDAYRKIPRPFWPIFSRFFLLPSFKNYLYSILNGLAFYSETGQKVNRNQFGRHGKFSP